MKLSVCSSAVTPVVFSHSAHPSDPTLRPPQRDLLREVCAGRRPHLRPPPPSGSQWPHGVAVTLSGCASDKALGVSSDMRSATSSRLLKKRKCFQFSGSSSGKREKQTKTNIEAALRTTPPTPWRTRQHMGRPRVCDTLPATSELGLPSGSFVLTGEANTSPPSLRRLP